MHAPNAAAAVMLFVLALFVQVATGAYVSDATAYADDPAHLLSGLMVRDYVVHGLGSSPVQFARDYYAHYPKIAIGNWPPLFHGLQGLWLLLLPTHPSSVLVLLALVAAGVAYVVHQQLRPRLGAPWAVLGAATFLLLAPVPYFTGAVMAEIPLTLFCTLAVIAWSRFMDRMRSRDVLLFALWTVLAILTKWNGLLLLLVPPVSLALSGRWRVLRAPIVWKAAAAVLLMTVPLVLLAVPTLRSGWDVHDRMFGIVSDTAAYYVVEIPRTVGRAVLAMTVLGAGVRLLRPRGAESADSTLWATAAAMMIATLGFHLIAPAGVDPRHMIPAYPFMAMFIAFFALSLADLLRRWLPHRRVATALAVAAVGGIVIVEARPLRNGHLDGFGAVAAALVPASPDTGGISSLVSSDPAGEGALIVQVAFRDRQRPRHVVWRSTKLLGSATWAGRDYRLRADSTSGVLRLLERAAIGTVVVDRSVERFPHQLLLERTIQAHPERFRLRDRLPVVRNRKRFAEGLLVYDFVQPGAGTPVPQLRQVPGYDGVESIGRGPGEPSVSP